MFENFDKLSIREFLHKQVEEFEATDVPRSELAFIMFMLSKVMKKERKKFKKLHELFKKRRQQHAAQCNKSK